MNIVVAGAGIAGLAAAVRLSARHDVVVFESAAVAGGKIHTQAIDGFTFDWGPNGFLSNATDVADLARDAGIEDRCVPADAAARKRFIYWGGRLHALAPNPVQIAATPLLSIGGKTRAVRELFVPPRQHAAGPDESVHDFFARRFGDEVAERIVAPALLGITGGNARSTAAGAVFPRLLALEKESGSVIRGMFRARPKPGKLTGFAGGGMQRLSDALAQRLGDRLRVNTPVERIERHADSYRVAFRGGQCDAGAVIVATPADAAAALVESLDAELAALLRTIDYAPMRVAGVAFRAADVPVPLDGFGFLAARGQGVRILGSLYTSTIFPEQAAAGTAYIRVFIGGAEDRSVVNLDSETLRAIVLTDLKTTLGVTAPPVAFHEVCWPRAIPQYDLSHRALLASIDARIALHPNMALIGNAYRGLGLGDTVRDAIAVAERMP